MSPLKILRCAHFFFFLRKKDVHIWCKEDAIYILLIYLAVFTYVTVAMSFMEIIEAQLNQYEIWAAFGWHYIVGV